MRTTTLVLLVVGVGLLLGGALVASLRIPCRVQFFTIKPSIDFQITRIDTNVWGQPLFALANSRSNALANQDAEVWATEAGPYPRGVRQGKWRRVTHVEFKPDDESYIWYLDGREVSAAEWEQRH